MMKKTQKRRNKNRRWSRICPSFCSLISQRSLTMLLHVPSNRGKYYIVLRAWMSWQLTWLPRRDTGFKPGTPDFPLATCCSSGKFHFIPASYCMFWFRTFLNRQCVQKRTQQRTASRQSSPAFVLVIHTNASEAKQSNLFLARVYLTISLVFLVIDCHVTCHT